MIYIVFGGNRGKLFIFDIPHPLWGDIMVKERNVFLVVLFTFITFGIYGIYWLVVTTNELKEMGQDAPNPWLLILMLIPVVNIVIAIIYYWKYSKCMEGISEGRVNSILMFIIWLVFGLASMIWGQIELNKHVGAVAQPQAPVQEPIQPQA